MDKGVMRLFLQQGSGEAEWRARLSGRKAGCREAYINIQWGNNPIYAGSGVGSLASSNLGQGREDDGLF